MKLRELKDLTEEELQHQLLHCQQALFNLRLQQATGGLENNKKIALTKKEIARIMTLLHHRKQGKGKETKAS